MVPPPAKVRLVVTRKGILHSGTLAVKFTLRELYLNRPLCSFGEYIKMELYRWSFITTL